MGRKLLAALIFAAMCGAIGLYLTGLYQIVNSMSS
jgi:hypothetical protein